MSDDKPKRLQKAYKTVMADPFQQELKICFQGKAWDSEANGGEGGMVTIAPQELRFTKVTWNIDGKDMGLRYGENPGQPCAVYAPLQGQELVLGGEILKIGSPLATGIELLQSGKHPSKTNLTDVDNAINILRFLTGETPNAAVAIMKHNNPCGVALRPSLAEAYQEADLADRVAAFGGAIVMDRSVDKATAEAIIENYSEVVAAPEFDEGVMEIFAKMKNLRVCRVPGMQDLASYKDVQTLDFKVLVDNGFVVQRGFLPQARTPAAVRELPLGYHDRKGEEYRVARVPSEAEQLDMWFGWCVEAGVTSNSVIYVKNLATVGIGTGEQDRVGVAEIARDKAYTKLRDRICYTRFGISYNEMLEKAEGSGRYAGTNLKLIDALVAELKGGLKGATMVSDAFFPKPDGVLVGLREGVRSIIQAGGSISDYQVIDAVNKYDATMVFTGQRSFKH